MAAPLLQFEKVTLRFGGLTAVNAVDLALAPGELHGLIGPNGAGKTTLFNLITGVYAPTAGAIVFDGQSLVGLRPDRIVARGVARTFQNIRLFTHLSVFDNVRAACNLHRRVSPLQALVRGKTFRADESATGARAHELLALFHLDRFSDTAAGALPYGEQRRLEIARALATQPRLLLLDEPAAGMNPAEKAELARLIREIHQRFQLTLLLVEHSMKVVMSLCQRITVLDHGVKIAEGTPGEIQSNPQVIEAYLGEASTTLKIEG